MSIVKKDRSTAGRAARVLGAAVLVFLAVAALAVAGVACLAHGLLDGVNINVEGERWLSGGPDAGQLAAAAVGLLLAALVVMTVVPMALALAFGAVALAVGMVVLPLMLVVLLVLSPLWLLLLLLWLALRKPRQSTTTMST